MRNVICSVCIQMGRAQSFQMVIIRAPVTAYKWKLARCSDITEPLERQELEEKCVQTLIYGDL